MSSARYAGPATAACLVIGALAVSAGDPPSTQPTATEAELLADMRAQPIGSHTLDDLQLPEELLRRCGDRLIRKAFERQFRIVVHDSAPGAAPSSQPAATASAPTSKPFAPIAICRVVRHVPAPDAAALAAVPEARPALRGFRAPLTPADSAATAPPAIEPGILQAAADRVARRLAREGLRAALVHVLESPALMVVVRSGDVGAVTQLLDRVGFPTDLLSAFGGSPTLVLDEAVARLARGESAEAVIAELQRREFHWPRRESPFRAADESGAEGIGLMRLQLTRGTYWQGEGDGCSLDIVRQLAAVAPDIPLLLSIQSTFEGELMQSLAAWPGPPRSMTVVVEPYTVAQWAQDNGKAGSLVDSDGRRRLATLTPRYASRGEDGSTFVPGESLLARGLMTAEHAVVQSPLIFQGGNLLVVTHPATRARLLLVGEAEIYRNTALGLSYDQTIEAFRSEFDVQRCLVLPAVAFHIDTELCARGGRDRLVAFVNDTAAGVQLVLSAGTDALRSGGIISAADADAARRHLAGGAAREFLATIAPPVMNRAVRFGHFPESLARLFTAGGVDSGVGNFQRFLLALDVLTLEALAPGEQPQSPPSRDYLAALRRSAAQRTALHQQLEREGFELVRIPGLPDAERAINYVNGVHDLRRYFMPACGGLYAPLDAAAAGAFRAALGPGVEVIPIVCSESQRRAGALHCSIAAYPALVASIGVPPVRTGETPMLPESEPVTWR
ncbi:hypothetical protein RAS1_21020 [Phycisphaerae bacterium RAS1]|nr:hypothetical protein RAS1_21020 [Phycisphaerae bacterium RAS1]